MSNIQNIVDFRMIASVKSGELLEVLFKSFFLLLERLVDFQDFIIQTNHLLSLHLLCLGSTFQVSQHGAKTTPT